MWTREETIKTGINIDTVKLSKVKDHNVLSDSLSIHLNIFIVTGASFKPASKKETIANSVVKITDKLVINWAPRTPTFLPKKPATIAPNKGKIIIARYIIYIRLLYFLLICKMRLGYLNL